MTEVHGAGRFSGLGDGGGLEGRVVRAGAGACGAPRRGPVPPRTWCRGGPSSDPTATDPSRSEPLDGRTARTLARAVGCLGRPDRSPEGRDDTRVAVRHRWPEVPQASVSGPRAAPPTRRRRAGDPGRRSRRRRARRAGSPADACPIPLTRPRLRLREPAAAPAGSVRTRRERAARPGRGAPGARGRSRPCCSSRGRRARCRRPGTRRPRRTEGDDAGARLPVHADEVVGLAHATGGQHLDDVVEVSAVRGVAR